MSAAISHDLAALAGVFQLKGAFQTAEPYGCGHINDTFLVVTDARRYVLQRINHHVFRNTEGLMANVAGVTAFLRSRIEAAGGDPERETLNLVPTVDGKTHHVDAEGYCWRVYLFVEGARTYEKVESLSHIELAGRAIADFQKILADYPAATLVETIPNFHHTARRFEALEAAIARDTAGRAASVAEEIAFARARKAECSRIVDLIEAGRIPLRVTHNDTKFNNIMLDDVTGAAVCVIDLDTVMPGSALYDFGDALRSSTNTAAEDETDLSKVGCNLEVFQAYAKGYLSSAKDFLTADELANLAFSAKLMTFECGIRFLMDHLDGDVYFKTKREGHNLDRCRNQFQLVADMEAKAERMDAMVREAQA